MTTRANALTLVHRRGVSSRVRAVVVCLLGIGSLGLAAGAATSASASPLSHPRAQYPVGVPDAHELSGKAPPAANAMPGYVRSYVTEFPGKVLPSGWSKFSGQPSGNPDAYWSEAHVVVGGGVVRLLTYRHAGRWVSGGMCMCARPLTYGAIFVRSRMTAPGPDNDELLWPVANVWPPEVDFNETAYSAFSTSWTVHFGSSTAFVQGTHSFDLERWHTWGVIWTPSSLTFTMDGKVWGTVTNKAEVPHQAMTLDIDQEARCNGTKWAACPTGTATLQINWVTEFTKS